MSNVREEIKKMVNKETKAWDNQDADTLVSIFHPDMVWPWPKSPEDHDPMNWVLFQGRYDPKRWRKKWENFFNKHILKHNNRVIRKIVVSDEDDGAFAVVDIDTLWINERTHNKEHWKGRTCKVYTKVDKEWKLIMHTGVLKYDN